MEMNGLNWMLKTFPEEKEEEKMRRFLGRYGLTGKQQVLLVIPFYTDIMKITKNISIASICNLCDTKVYYS